MTHREIGLMGIVLVWVAIFLAHVDARSLTKEEDSELKAKLKFLNRPAVKSIYTEEGDIFDCVNVRKQPAFDHPLLKNHQIQMRPTILPEGVEIKDHSNISSLFGLKDRGCPSDTVPIRRTKAEDLLRASSLSNFGRKNGFNITTSVDGFDHHYARVSSKEGEFYGTQVGVNTWNPQLADSSQMSLAQTWVVKGSGSQLNTVEVGWQVSKMLYGDDDTHLFIYWTADGYYKTGCYNLLCSGFVQVGKYFTPGVTLKPYSTFNGNQMGFYPTVFKDIPTGNWWLKINNDLVGYWPKSIFTSLQGSAGKVIWGGEVATRHDLSKPGMGSGLFPKRGFRYSCFMMALKVINNQNSLIDAPDDIFTDVDVPSCYDVDGLKDGSKDFFFGGPGGYC